jgi:RNA polymerase sigma-70 factor (ECF subfamily)
LLRTTVVLTTLQGLSHPEAAAVLNTTEGTIAWRMHEARNQLRRALDEATVGAPRSVPAPPRRSARRTCGEDPDTMSCALALALASVVTA